MRTAKLIALAVLTVTLSGLLPTLHADGWEEDPEEAVKIQQRIEALKKKEKAKRKAAREKKAEVSIVIYHTSDVHGGIDYYKGDTAKKIPPSGGAASLATLFKTQGRDLYLDSGDWFSGTMVGDGTKGDAVFAAFEALKLDATLVGNHDYDLGEANLARLVKSAKGKFSVLGSNVSGTSGVKADLIKDVKGVKIGIFGILTTEMSSGLATQNNVAASSFADEVKTAQARVDDLRQRGAQIVIALTHLGIEKYDTFSASNIKVGDIHLANNVTGIDLILGGHTHVKMDPPLTVGQTVIFQPGGHMGNAYRIELNVDTKTGAIKKIDAKLIALDPATYAPDKKVQDVVDSYTKLVNDEAKKSVGSAAVALDTNSKDEGLVYNWATDVFQRYGKTDLGLVNTFGIRKGLPQGPLTYGDVYGMMPFQNQMTSIKLTGRELWKTVECSLPQAAGDAIMLRFSKELRVEYSSATTTAQKDQLKDLCETHTANAPVVIRVVSLKVNGKAVPADATQTYTVETMDYVALSELQLKRGVDVQDLNVTSQLTREMLADEIRNTSPIDAKLDGRIKAVGTP